MNERMVLVTEASQFAGFDLWPLSADLFRTANVDTIAELANSNRCLMFSQN